MSTGGETSLLTGVFLLTGIFLLSNKASQRLRWSTEQQDMDSKKARNMTQK
eukprot:CAMPEP_0115320956 /NCGR_PEP_ID=MMETSP0270-20121206/80602_1 /TAXON_ID=71861 /ORGANISM="Scrippsiella trochoidea, Strain CCMP3099" /LENGTH=50 /DNA_ID=CAMNT_0002740803 /DNA_START=367 /DNA_END=516 /DNA_ORIENTATION=+